jgi:uncharacterized protein YneF (UPF0154 family)
MIPTWVVVAISYMAFLFGFIVAGIFCVRRIQELEDKLRYLENNKSKGDLNGNH